jgi:hypothetical protein
MCDTRKDRIERAFRAEAETAMHARLDAIRDLVKLAAGDEGHEVTDDRAGELGLDPDGDGPAMFREDAEERLREYLLSIETTTTFEVVLGTGGPDDRLIFECSVCGRAEQRPGEGSCTLYEIDQVLYYSRIVSAERVLSGDDLAVAEAFGRRVVPELAE